MFAFLCLACAAAPPADGPVKVVAAPGDALRVRVVAVLPPSARSLPVGELKQEQGERVLSFARVDPRSGKAGDGMFGRYERVGDKLVFTPRHALLDGQRYRATLAGGAASDYLAPARVVVGVPSVLMIYPSTDVLPANQLKFYVHFSRPMRETSGIFDHVRIVDDQGKPVEDPWRRTQLWNADGTRLTLLIHPGRIKQGVNLNTDLGPVLEPNRKYTLEIDGKVRDADDVPLGKTHRKKFSTTKAERSFVLAEDWSMKEPKQGTREALTLSFPRPLDHALLQRMVSVVDQNKKPVAGRVSVGREEKSLAFVPSAPWQGQEYRVVVDPDLEDLAGNTPEQLFDVNNEAPETPPKPQTLRFRPGR